MLKMLLDTNYTDILFFAQQEPQPGGGMGFLLVMGLMFAAMWFLLIAPQRKKQKELQRMISELKSGDEILTVGGVYGTITNVKDDRFVVKISESTKIELNKSHVQSLVSKKS